MTITEPPDEPRNCTCGNRENSRAATHANEWLTPEDLVAALRGAVTLGTLRNYRSARIGPEYIRVGRAIFYPRAAVDTWLAQQIRESADRWADRA